MLEHNLLMVQLYMAKSGECLASYNSAVRQMSKIMDSLEMGVDITPDQVESMKLWHTVAETKRLLIGVYNRRTQKYGYKPGMKLLTE